MNRRRILFRKRRFLGLLKLRELSLLGLFPRAFAPDSIDRDSMCNAVEPRPQRTWLFQLPYATKDFDPRILKLIEPIVLIARQTGRVIQQRPLHHGNEILE